MSASFGARPLVEAFAAGADDPVRALDRALAAAERGRDDRALLAFTPRARADAEAARARYQLGRPLGPLDGVPVVVKDCIDVAGVPTTIGTRFLTTPAAADAELVQRLRAAGAVVFAKANMHEFGIQPTGVNPHHGTPVNPWLPDRIPGGSSSGSAVSVASGIATLAVGTDAGGSVRVPAALNGLVGLKGTFGGVPDAGMARLTVDLDHAGPIAWTVDDATDAYEVLAGVRLDRGAAPGKLALLGELFEGIDGEVAATVRGAAREVFGELEEVRSPATAWATQVEFVVVGMQSQQVLGEYYARHQREIGHDARTILQLSFGMPEVYRQRAVRTRERMKAELDALLERHDLLVGPAVGCVAPRLLPIAARHGELDTTTMARLAGVTFPANLTGLPCVSVPCFRDGRPMAMQLIGRRHDEARVLAAARWVERAFGPRRPPRWHGG